MSVKNIVVGNILVTYWDEVMAVEEVREVGEDIKRLYERVGPIVSLVILGHNFKRPPMDVVEFMSAGQEEMQGYHRSIHYLVLVQGFIAASVMSIVGRVLTVGSGGRVHFHKTAEEALSKAEEYGPLLASPPDVIRFLKSSKIPLEKLK